VRAARDSFRPIGKRIYRKGAALLQLLVICREKDRARVFSKYLEIVKRERRPTRKETAAGSSTVRGTRLRK